MRLLSAKGKGDKRKVSYKPAKKPAGKAADKPTRAASQAATTTARATATARKAPARPQPTAARAEATKPTRSRGTAGQMEKVLMPGLGSAVMNDNPFLAQRRENIQRTMDELNRQRNLERAKRRAGR